MGHGRHGWPIRQFWPMPSSSAIPRVLQLHAPKSRMSWFAAGRKPRSEGACSSPENSQFLVGLGAGALAHMCQMLLPLSSLFGPAFPWIITS